jgi:glycerophosphoryl diester phosphodiesterase
VTTPVSWPAPPTAPSWLREVPLAHRGLHEAGVPENSMPAFEAAADAGYGVELDVYLSRDEVPVILHDASLQRMTGAELRVGQLTAAQLAKIRLNGSDAHIPTLADALAVLREVPVMVEIKQPRVRAGKLEERIAEVLERHPGPYCVASFNPSAVRWFRRNRPETIRVLTASPFADVRLPRAIRTRLAELRDLPSVDPHGVSYDLEGLPNPATDAWRARGGPLVAWTAVGEDGLRRGRELADNVVFEDVRP